MFNENRARLSRRRCCYTATPVASFKLDQIDMKVVEQLRRLATVLDKPQSDSVGLCEWPLQTTSSL